MSGTFPQEAGHGDVVEVERRPLINRLGSPVRDPPLVVGIRMANEVSRDEFVGFGKSLPFHRERVVIPETRETGFRHDQGNRRNDG